MYQYFVCSNQVNRNGIPNATNKERLAYQAERFPDLNVRGDMDPASSNQDGITSPEGQ